MLAVSSPPFTRPFCPLISVALSANSQPSRRRSLANQKQHQFRKQNRENQNHRGTTRNQLSGLDVLWAMQRAAAEKNRPSGGRSRKNRKKEEPQSLSEGGEREEDSEDYCNVRPLLIQNDWGSRLEDLQKRLQELSEDK